MARKLKAAASAIGLAVSYLLTYLDSLSGDSALPIRPLQKTEKCNNDTARVALKRTAHTPLSSGHAGCDATAVLTLRCVVNRLDALTRTIVLQEK